MAKCKKCQAPIIPDTAQGGTQAATRAYWPGRWIGLCSTCGHAGYTASVGQPYNKVTSVAPPETTATVATPDGSAN